jgi:hypothetical protein
LGRLSKIIVNVLCLVELQFLIKQLNFIKFFGYFALSKAALVSSKAQVRWDEKLLY